MTTIKMPDFKRIDTSAARVNAAIEAKMKDGLSRNDALMAIAKEQPEIIAAVRGGK